MANYQTVFIHVVGPIDDIEFVVETEGGATGPAGPAGPPGPAGAASLAPVVLRRTTDVNSNGTFEAVTFDKMMDTADGTEDDGSYSGFTATSAGLYLATVHFTYNGGSAASALMAVKRDAATVGSMQHTPVMTVGSQSVTVVTWLEVGEEINLVAYGQSANVVFGGIKLAIVKLTA